MFTSKNNLKFKIALVLLNAMLVPQLRSQTLRALFLGNSYVYTNNLPQMIASAAGSTGDSLIYDANCPGGYTLELHSTNTVSQGKIAAGNWDYVVLQEQSQLPAMPIFTVVNDVFPYAKILNDSILAHNPCAETVFYRTWGRKNGDATYCASWPPVCTYSGMDSLLAMRYQMMADSNAAVVSPVGTVWNYIRQNFPLIDLYSADESHPSVAGTYAAACSFYSTFYRKDPTGISYNPGLPAADAANIRIAAKVMVYDSLLNWNIGKYDPQASFVHTGGVGNEIIFTNTSLNSQSYTWYFGDGTSSVALNPSNVYAFPGSYWVMLVAENCGRLDTAYQLVVAGPLGINEVSQASFQVYPNPSVDELHVVTSTFFNCNYRIVNSLGCEVLNGILDQKKSINLGSLPDGIYLLSLYDQKINLGNRKFVKRTK